MEGAGLIAQIEGCLHKLGPFPRGRGRVASVCVRPGPELRAFPEELVLDCERGALGDRWERKTWVYTPEGKPDPRVQVAIGNIQILETIQRLTGNWTHPGDTLLVDLDLSETHLPTGTRLEVGTALLEVSEIENDACARFAKRHGQEIFEWIRHPENRPRRLRGLFARVVKSGLVRPGDSILRLEPLPV